MKEHYKSLYKQFGESPQALQWRDQATQHARFKILAEIDLKMNSVIDIGCGFGDFHKYLKDSIGFNGTYLGLDFVSEFIETANKKYTGNSNVSFRNFDLKTESIPLNHEYGCLSGVFNNKMEDNKEFMLNSIKKMFDACSKGIAFNSLSTYVDYFDENLFYSNPLEIFDFCKKELSKKVTLRHDYLVKENSIPFEYTIYVFK